MKCLVRGGDESVTYHSNTNENCKWGMFYTAAIISMTVCTWYQVRLVGQKKRLDHWNLQWLWRIELRFIACPSLRRMRDLERPDSSQNVYQKILETVIS